MVAIEGVIEKDVDQMLGEIVLNFIRMRLSSMFIKLPDVLQVVVLVNLLEFTAQGHEVKSCSVRTRGVWCVVSGRLKLPAPSANPHIHVLIRLAFISVIWKRCQVL